MVAVTSRILLRALKRLNTNPKGIHLWYIYWHLVDYFYGKRKYYKYTIHGSYGKLSSSQIEYPKNHGLDPPTKRGLTLFFFRRVLLDL